jgi:hypothetical protein
MKANLQNIREKGFAVLTKELGAAGMAQFVRQFDNGHGDYTQERQTLLKGILLDDIADSIARRKKSE